MTRAAFGISGESVQSSFGQTSSALASCALMADLMGSGVLVLDRRGEPLFANALARKLLVGETAADEHAGEHLSGQVKNLLSLLDAMVGSVEGEHPPARAAVPWPSPQSYAAVVSGACTSVSTSLQIEVSPLAGDPRRGYVVVLNDGGTATQLADELLTASRMRSRDYIYHALLHDLRAPLNALEINLELLVDNCAHCGDGGVVEDAGQRQMGQGLRQMGQGLMVLREELARLNRTLRVVLDGGELFRPLVDNFDLAEALREVALLLSPQARQQHVAIQLQFPDNAVLVDGHRDRLKQAFINVAVNALEAMQDGGRLVIAIDRAQDSVRIRFTDDGGGIPAALRERVFDVRFTTKPGGNGMGLFVARLVANTHGGEVRINNGAGAGCTIEFVLPVAGGLPQV